MTVHERLKEIEGMQPTEDWHIIACHNAKKAREKLEKYFDEPDRLKGPKEAKSILEDEGKGMTNWPDKKGEQNEKEE